MLRVKLAIFGALLVTGYGYADVPEPPSLKPQMTYASTVVSTQDAATFRKALSIAKRSDWRALRRQLDTARSEPVAKFMLWRLTTGARAEAGFDMLDRAMREVPDWPRARSIRIYAEDAISSSALSIAERIAWFEIHGGAISGKGKIAYADALYRSGDTATAFQLVREAWRTSSLNRSIETKILQRYDKQLTAEDHEARANYLLWARQTTAAKRLRSRVSPDYRLLIDARVSLIGRGSNVDGKVRAVPASLKDDPGLLFDRAYWRRKRARNQSGATDLLVQINGADVPSVGRDNLWDERNIAIRAALKANQYDTAYRLAAPHGLSRGADFADAEWTAGWIALRLLDDAERALQHFDTLKAGVTTPISLSRAEYWRGRAYKAINDSDGAQAAYQAASIHNFAYYGQLAAEQVRRTEFVLEKTPVPSEADREAFRQRHIIAVLRLLGEANEAALFRQFSYHIDDQLETATEQLLLSEIAREYQNPDIGVRGGKAGLGRGIIAPEAAYPVINLPLRREVEVENALVLALSRQESELNPRAISHANARGLMQMLPRTAQTQARREGLPYRISWLTDDPAYNMTLGASHLDDLLSQFNGSYIMTAAAYNAGASRPKRWIKDYGDPRRGEIDPVDWVEFIPFSETRNYVQRVLENVQVYRHRISGEPSEIRLSEDLQRGRLR